MYQSPNVPRSIGGVLDDSIQLFRASFSKAVVPALLMSAVVVSVQLLIQLGSGTLGAQSTGMRSVMGAATAASAAAGSAVVSIAASLFDIVLYGTIVLITLGVARGEAPTFRTAFAGAWRRFGAMLGASILVGLAGGLGFILAAIPIFLSLSGLTRGATFPQIIAQLTPQILESLVLSLPVIYVLFRMMLYIACRSWRVAISILRRLGTSWRLVGGNWWRTSTVVFVLGIVVYILMIVVIAVAGAGAGFVVGRAAGSQPAAVAAALSVGIALGATKVISSPLICAMIIAIYRDLQLRKGGGDLEARLGALRKS